MSTAPIITIYVRHAAECKYEGDEFARQCMYRKHLRWSQGGKQYRRTAGTRRWAEAELIKRDLADRLSGRTAAPVESEERDIRSASDLFIAAKQVEGISEDGVTKYKLWLDRLAAYGDRQGVYTVRGITGEVVIGFCSSWKTQYPSPLTRNKLREHYKAFMQFCQEQLWIERLPTWPKMLADAAPTLPITGWQYASLLDSVYVVVKAPQNAVVENQTDTY